MKFGLLEARWIYRTGPSRSRRVTPSRSERCGASEMGPRVPAGISATYLLFSSPSSTNVVQYPVGFAVVAFLITVIFIVRSWGLSCAGDVMCQRNEGRFETPLVTCRLVHVAKLGVRRHK